MSAVAPTSAEPDPKSASGGTRSGSWQNVTGAVISNSTTEKAAKKRFEKGLNGFLNQGFIQILLAITLLLSLFLPDFWTISNPDNKHDIVLNVILVSCIVIFVWEMIVTSLAKPREYNIRALFFYLDLVGTVSILLDITWTASLFFFLQSGNSNPTVLRAARVAKLGARASRLAKFAKLVKFYLTQDAEAQNDSDSAKKISMKLSQLLATRVAGLLLLFVMINPFLQTVITDYSFEAFASNVNVIMTTPSLNASMTAESWGGMVDSFNGFYNDKEASASSVSTPYVLEITGLAGSQCPTSMNTDAKEVKYSAVRKTCTWQWESAEENLRDTNILYFPDEDHESKNGDQVYIEFDKTLEARDEAGYSAALIALVIVLLVGFSLAFNASMEKLVVKPLSRIMDKLRSTAASVLSSVKDLSNEEDEEDEDGMDETDLLEMMVDKLARIVKNSTSNGLNNMLDQNRDIIDDNTEAYLNQFSNETKQKIQTGSSKALSVEKHFVSTSELPRSEELILSFEFDTLDLTHDELVPCAIYMFQHLDLLSEFSIDTTVFKTWVGQIRIGYKVDPQYHNWWHGVDVLHTTFKLMTSVHAEAFLSKLEMFATLVAAISHDLGHPGINNNFLVKSKDALALKYNDKSPLENMHCATLYDIVSDQAADIFAMLTDDQWHSCRKQIVECILNTDMVNHFANVAKLQNFFEVGGDAIHALMAQVSAGVKVVVPEIFSDDTEGPKSRLLLQETFLHCADLSNPIKPLPIYEKWVQRVTEEFFAQGEAEKQKGFPVSAMMDRATTNIPNMQVGFISFIIAPLYSTLMQIFPKQLVVVGGNLVNNHHHYVDEAMREKRLKDGSVTQEDEDKTRSQKQKFREQLSFLSWDLLKDGTHDNLWQVATQGA